MEASAQSDIGLTFDWVQRISHIDKAEWDRLAHPLVTPFLEWGWLSALEESGSISPRYGWRPMHLAVRRDSQLVAAAPLYIKTHSEGELIFDYAWADAAHQVGAQYYPKLVGMSPATPSPGYQFLFAEDEDPGALTERMLAEIEALCTHEQLAGVHFQYADPRWGATLRQAGFHEWLHQSYEWRNRDYRTFDDYLAAFNKNQRRNIRRERASVRGRGITVIPIEGTEVTDRMFDTMYRYYDEHNAQFGPWAARFLNHSFFRELAPRYRGRLVFIAAYRDGDGQGAGGLQADAGARAALARRPGTGRRRSEQEPIALSLLVAKGQRLVGRYWGAAEWHDNLHFEVCYYAPIEYAIRTGRRSFDPGIGSAHKLRRGFEAVGTLSLHRFRDARMQSLMSMNIGRINAMQQRQITEMNRHVPFARRS